MRFRPVVLAGFLFLWAMSPGILRAEKKEWTLSLAPAYVFSYVDDRALHGGGANLDVTYGVTDNLSVRAAGTVSWQAAPSTATATSGTVSAFSAMAGVHYAIDVLRLVPSFDFSVGAIAFRGGSRYATSPAAESILKPVTGFGAELGFNLDWLITRHVSLGWLLRFSTVLTDITRAPVYLYTGPRVTFRFGG